MDLSVSVPHPHATLLLSPSASMPMTVIDVVTVVVKVIFVAVPYFKTNHLIELEPLEPLPLVTSVKRFSFAGPLDPSRFEGTAYEKTQKGGCKPYDDATRWSKGCRTSTLIRFRTIDFSVWMSPLSISLSVAS